MIRVKSTDDTRLQSAIIVYADFVYLFGWKNRVKSVLHPTEPLTIRVLILMNTEY